MSEKITTTTTKPTYYETQLARFLEDCTEADAYSSVRPGALYTRYQQWCWDEKERAMDPKLFDKLMRERGIRKSHSTGRLFWRNLRIKEEV
ncbi:MAG: hypothetical protein LUE89_09545 [Clostridiales bacterium]|nr:hypothetical protein [Clostridiales bacterium]